MTRLAIRLAAALAATATLVGISATSAFASVLPPEGESAMRSSSEGTSTLVVGQTTTSPLVWVLAGALTAVAVIGLYLLASAIVHRTRTPSVG